MNTKSNPSDEKKSMGTWLQSNRTVLISIIAKLFILLFVYAASSKLLEYDKFKAQLGQSPMLSSFAPLLVWSIPALEIAIAIMENDHGRSSCIERK
jgi:hypothetical protein